MNIPIKWLLPVVLGLVPVMPALADYRGLFDVDARKQALQMPELASIRNDCLKVVVDPDWQVMPVVKALQPTDGYGSDRSANDFSWAVMVLSGRSLAGDRAATSDLKALLLRWAGAGAFAETPVSHDPYYALKRVMLPVTVAYSVIERDLNADERAILQGWISPLVQRVDQVFDGEVDRNNHRILADSVLGVWGSLMQDDALLDKAAARFRTTIDQARPDGSLPLETRRGARALWYMRHALASLTVIGETAKGRGVDLYGYDHQGVSIDTLFGFLVTGFTDSVLVNAYAAQNYIPGPNADFWQQDLGFLDNRGNGRHYLASLEAALASVDDEFTRLRLKGQFDAHARDERPLIDEYAGGNATCFWGVAK